MKNQSFWEKEAFNSPFDLIVAGAGIVGLSSALFYKQQHPDARVAVLERGCIPEGASTRNAGFACFGSVTEFMADLENETERNVKKLVSRRYRGLQLLRKTLGDEMIGYEPCGGYELFTNRLKFEEAATFLPRFNDWFLELTGEKDVLKPMALNKQNVVYNRLEGALHPGRMMQVLIDRVQAAGVQIQWNSRVIKTEPPGKIYLENGCSVYGNQILLACNGFSKAIAGEVDIEPARGLIMVSEPWQENPWKGIFHYDRGFVYFRNVGSRLLLGGGRNIAVRNETTDHFGVNDHIKQYLLDFADKELGFPRRSLFEYEWSGIMGFTQSKIPVIQRLDDYRTVAAGLSGMGIAIGMDLAKQAASMIDR